MDEKAMRERFGFEIEDASHEIRVLRWKDCGCRPAGAEEIALWDALTALSQPAAPGWVSGCQCGQCRPISLADSGSVRMILCSICGNKRCPHANDHRNTCTGSNEPGQPGSSYPDIFAASKATP